MWSGGNQHRRVCGGAQCRVQRPSEQGGACCNGATRQSPVACVHMLFWRAAHAMLVRKPATRGAIAMEPAGARHAETGPLIAYTCLPTRCQKRPWPLGTTARRNGQRGATPPNLKAQGAPSLLGLRARGRALHLGQARGLRELHGQIDQELGENRWEFEVCAWSSACARHQGQPARVSWSNVQSSWLHTCACPRRGAPRGAKHARLQRQARRRTWASASSMPAWSATHSSAASISSRSSWEMDSCKVWGRGRSQHQRQRARRAREPTPASGRCGVGDCQANVAAPGSSVPCVRMS